MQCLENGNLVTHTSQIACTGQTGRACTNDGNLVAVGFRLYCLLGAVFARVVGNEALQTADGYGLALDAADTVALALAGCGSKSADSEKDDKADLPKFRIGAIPDQDTAELQKGNDAVAAYLSDYLGFDVEFVPTVDYASLVEGFQRGDIQLAWFGGLTYVQTRNIVSDCTPLIQRPVDQSFQSVFIKNTELAGNVNSISDLKGKTFTFGSESSTSGHLMPRYFMEQEGLNVNRDIKGGPNYSG